jgi:hypothetical protein
LVTDDDPIAAVTRASDARGRLVRQLDTLELLHRELGEAFDALDAAAKGHGWDAIEARLARAHALQLARRVAVVAKGYDDPAGDD